MRNLRQIAQAPGDLAFRLELIAAIDRIRLQHEVDMRTIVQNQKTMQRSISHITPVELAKLVNKQIEQKEKAKDSDKLRNFWKQFASHFATAVTSVLVAMLIARLKQ